MLSTNRMTYCLLSGSRQLRVVRAVGGPIAYPCYSLKRPESLLTWNCFARYHTTDSDFPQSKCPRMTSASSDSRIFTVPNILTSSRILLTPAIGYFIWHEMHPYALSCFTIAALTDLFDGLLARQLNQCSKIGAILDPIADKLLLTTCFLSLYHVNLMPYWLVGSFILRDIALLGGGLVLRYRSFKCQRPDLRKFLDFNQNPEPNFSPTFLSKCNTALQCGLIVTHLTTSHLSGAFYYDLSIASLHALTASTTIVSFGQYLIRAATSKSKRLSNR